MTTSALRLLPTPEPLEQAVAAFGRRLAAEGRSPNTISAYLRDLRQLTSVLLERHPSLTLGRVTSALLDEALTSPALVNSAAGTPRSPASLHRFKATVRSFFAWAEETGQGRREPGPVGDLETAAAHHAELPDRGRETAAVEKAPWPVL